MLGIFTMPQKINFLIDYDIPCQFLAHFLKQINIHNRPITIIGYSQGGYLCPFLSEKNILIKHILGINCSYREDKLNQIYQRIDLKLDLINSDQDHIIDYPLSKKRYQKIKQRLPSSCSGKHILLKNQSHKITSQTIVEIKRLLFK